MSYHYGWYSTDRNSLPEILREGFRVSEHTPSVRRSRSSRSVPQEQRREGRAPFGTGAYFSKNKISCILKDLLETDLPTYRRFTLLNYPFPRNDLLQEIQRRLAQRIFIYCRFNIENLFHFDGLNAAIYRQQPYCLASIVPRNFDVMYQRLGFDGALIIQAATREEEYVVRYPENICILRVEDLNDQIIWSCRGSEQVASI